MNYSDIPRHDTLGIEWNGSATYQLCWDCIDDNKNNVIGRYDLKNTEVHPIFYDRSEVNCDVCGLIV